MLKPLFPLVFLLSLAFCTVGCGDDNDTAWVLSYLGYWDARYNIIIDECRLISPSLTGFTDQYEVAQTAATTVHSTSGFIADDGAALRDDDSLLAETRESGDLFGVGIQCEAVNTLSLAQTDEDKAEALFSQVITCADGWTCQSRAVGQALRLEPAAASE